MEITIRGYIGYNIGVYIGIMEKKNGNYYKGLYRV